VPVGGRRQQRLLVVERQRARRNVRVSIPCRFVPLVGIHGFPPPEPGQK
jgi:hypothetical protein